MKHKRNLIAFLLIAIAITPLGYLLDNDLPYEHWHQTALEFVVLTIVIFAVISAFYGIVLFLKSLLSNK
ncbi:hypothetical protein [Carboxylicivirga marina]|uniref:Uncharacterized protein n=1 Tax=Carboxylicivirga marina TaxID=2800988 RepID=A0ABS1HJH3_9BACT|nr:hypothetical protein [Carboxylicivirga marina]MBK3517339.1 hypothetical protein [Carboxylicivirga marina]